MVTSGMRALCYVLNVWNAHNMIQIPVVNTMLSFPGHDVTETFLFKLGIISQKSDF